MSDRPTDTRTRIILAARTLFYGIGYDSTSIQQIIDEVGIAKGTFYHHFSSKDQLLNELILMMTGQIITLMNQIVADENLSAVQKFNTMMLQSGYAKMNGTNFEIIMSIIKTMYRDENIVLRNKMFDETIKAVVPILAEVVQEGIDSGEFSVKNARLTAQVLMKIGMGMNEEFRVLSGDLSDEQIIRAIENFQEMADYFQKSCEKLLGAAPGSIHIYEPEMYALFREKLLNSTNKEEKND